MRTEWRGLLQALRQLTHNRCGKGLRLQYGYSNQGTNSRRNLVKDKFKPLTNKWKASFFLSTEKKNPPVYRGEGAGSASKGERGTGSTCPLTRSPVAPVPLAGGCPLPPSPRLESRARPAARLFDLFVPSLTAVASHPLP